MDEHSTRARRLALWFTALSTLAIFSLLPFSKITFAPTDLGALAYLIGVAAVFAFYCWKRRMYRLAPALEAIMLGLFMTVPVLVSTYLAASLNHPLADNLLIEADRALAFDWVAFIGFVDGHSGLAHTLMRAYTSFSFQLLGIPLLLGIVGEYERTYKMIIAYGLLCYISSFVSIWFPALGTYPVYGLAQEQLHNINAHYGFEFLNDFNAVRENSAFTLSLANASGIVTFPSVHAGVALLCAWAMWPVRPFNYLFAGWNVLMAISAVSNANHYMVDVVAGALISAFSIFAVTHALRWRARRGAQTTRRTVDLVPSHADSKQEALEPS